MKPTTTVRIPGKTYQFEEQQLRALEHSVDPSKIGVAGPYKVLSEIPGVCAFVGSLHTEKAEPFVIDSFPVFYGKELSPELLGAVLFSELARDLSVQHRLRPSWAVPQIGQLEGMCTDAYGRDITYYLTKEFTRKAVGTKNAKFLLARVARVLRANYPELSHQLVVGGRRLTLKGAGYTKLVQLDDRALHKNFHDLATSMGRAYLEALDVVRRERPELLAQDFFRVTEEPAGENTSALS